MSLKRSTQVAALVVVAIVAAGTMSFMVSARANSPVKSDRFGSRVNRDARGWAAVAVDDGKEPGWVNPKEPPAFAATVGGVPTDGSVGVEVVRNKAGKPIGYLGPSGFVRGGVNPDGTLKESEKASITGAVREATPTG